ncbi:HWE histidine kinase domain-containing protein [Rhizobium sp. Rhizsp42]|uniref:HWE histidine kinase domain-containing protein n=1 Tax=Rhizobium sp. Rhizsp42 TaxID=3243034 RepID=UPI0039AF7BBB
MFELEFKAATGLMQSDDFISLALSGHSVQGVEAFTLNESNSQPLLVSAAPFRVAGNETKGAVSTLVDLSRHKEAERQQFFLMRELGHRVKNRLALVVSISNRTASTEDTGDGFRRAFAGHIQALAASHNVLADRSWTFIRLSDLMVAELKPFVENFRTRSR